MNVKDFARLHHEYLEAEKAHAGIVTIPDQRYSIGEKIRRLAHVLGTVEAEQMRNRMEFL